MDPQQMIIDRIIKIPAVNLPRKEDEENPEWYHDTLLEYPHLQVTLYNAMSFEIWNGGNGNYLMTNEWGEEMYSNLEQLIIWLRDIQEFMGG